MDKPSIFLPKNASKARIREAENARKNRLEMVKALADGQVSRDMMLAHCRELAEASDVPLNADFEGGYADAPEHVAENVRLGIETGVAGISIEDSTGDAANPLYDFDLALARVRDVPWSKLSDSLREILAAGLRGQR